MKNSLILMTLSLIILTIFYIQFKPLAKILVDKFDQETAWEQQRAGYNRYASNISKEVHFICTDEDNCHLKE